MKTQHELEHLAQGAMMRCRMRNTLRELDLLGVHADQWLDGALAHLTRDEVDAVLVIMWDEALYDVTKKIGW